MPRFLSLPNELILEITDNLSLHDISALLQTNRRLSTLTRTLLTELFRSRSLTHGRRLLYEHASHQNLIAVKYLIDRGILDFTNPETLLHEAVIIQSVHVLETLLHFGLDPDMKDSKSRTPLGLAAKHGRVDFVKILAARGDVDVGWENYKFMTPLLLAVQNGQEEVVRILVQSAGADLRVFSDMSRKNCLHLAGMRGDVPILRFLLDFVDANEEDYLGQTALHLTARVGNCLAMKFLLEDQRVDANAQDQGGETVFHAAVLWDQLDIVKILLSHPRVETNKADSGGQTPLHVAVGGGNIDIIRLILSSPEVDVNLLDESPMGNTALHIAIGGGNLDIVQTFLEDSRVDINLPNIQGTSPLGLAVELGRSSIIGLLLQHPQVKLVLGPIDDERALDIPDLALTIGRERVQALIEEMGNGSW